MATGKDGAVGRQLRTLFNVGAVRELTDGQLLERFATGLGEGAELAFAALVERHGPMVLRVAGAVLDDPHDAQDAFQATFLVLVARARGLWVRDSLGPWLYQVARRTASASKASLARRRRLERKAARIGETARPEVGNDLARVLHEEIGRLPERYRAPVVLCDLEGRTHEQAARALGWPVGTVKSRQARARDRLRDQLRRRGVAPTLGLPVVWPTCYAPLSNALVESVTVAAVRFVASRAIAPGTAAVLAREVIRSMTILQWSKAATVLLALAGGAGGAGLIAQGQGGKPGETPGPAEVRQASRPLNPSDVEVKPGKLNWTLAEKGYVEVAKVYDTLCEIEGSTVIISLKPEGSRVKKGEVVAELDSTLLRDNLVNQRLAQERADAAFNQARLVREVAEFAVNEYEKGILPQERASLKGKAASARDQVEKGRERLERNRLARKRLDEVIARRVGAETSSDVVADLAIEDGHDGVERDIKTSERDLESAISQLDVLEKFTAQKNRKGLWADVEKARAEELSKNATWELEKTKERKLERQIERCSLHAAADGILVLANDPGRRGGQQSVQIEEGATVRERQKIFSIINPADRMRINAKVREAYIDQVPVGGRVRIKVHTYPNETLTGVVKSVAPMADTGRPGDAIKLYTTLVEIDKDAPDLALWPGMSADVEIRMFEMDDVLSVPVDSVIQLDGKDRVAIWTPEGGIELREVVLGRSNDQAVQVKQGLKPGDRVILDPVARMNDSEWWRARKKPATPPAGPR